MFTLMCSSLVLCAGIGAGDGAADLAKACEKLASAENYSFKVTSKTEGSGGFTPPGSDEPIAGEYQKSHPIHLKRGSDEIYRDKDQAVFKDGSEWKTLERPTFGGPRGGGRRGGDGGGAGGDEGGAGGGGGEGSGGGDREGGGRSGRRGAGGPGGPQMGAFALNSTPVPGQIVNDVSKKVADVTTETKDGKTVYVAKLTPEGARDLSGGPGGPPTRGRRDGGSGGGAGEGGGRAPEASGTLRITASADGQIEKIELDTKSKFSFGQDREFERHRTTTIELSNVGSTKVDVPKDADSKLHSM
jgi:hypothetical protein